MWYVDVGISKLNFKCDACVLLILSAQISAWAEERIAVSSGSNASVPGGDLDPQSAHSGDEGTASDPSGCIDINRRLIFHTTTLLGRRDDPLLDIYARQIIERIASLGDSRPLLLFICLQSPGAAGSHAAATDGDEGGGDDAVYVRAAAGRGAKCLNAALNVVYDLAGW
jgi:hypothetical protein